MFLFSRLKRRIEFDGSGEQVKLAGIIDVIRAIVGVTSARMKRGYNVGNS